MSWMDISNQIDEELEASWPRWGGVFNSQSAPPHWADNLMDYRPQPQCLGQIIDVEFNRIEEPVALLTSGEEGK